MKKWLFAIVIGVTLVLVLGACGSNNNDSASDNNTSVNDNSSDNSGTVDATAAKKVFEKNCASCHGADLAGKVGPNLQKVGSKYDKAEIADIIKNGKQGDKGTMPAGQAQGADVDLLASWLAQKK